MLVQSTLKGQEHLVFPALATACVNSPPLACPEPGSESTLVWILVLLPAQMMNCQSMSILGVLLFFFLIYCSFSVFFIPNLEVIPYSHQSCCHIAISITFLEGKEPEFYQSKCGENMNLTRGI